MALLLPGKLLYLATPRTASTSTALALQKLGARTVRGGHHVGVEAVAELEDELVFTTIRNPYDALVSWYVRMDRTRGFPVSMAHFLRKYEHEDFARGDPPSLFYHCRPGVEVLRWETLQEEFDALLMQLELPTVRLPRDNVTPKKGPWRDYYDAEALEAVHARFGHDLDSWDYERIS